jgi:DNA-binding NtrC family response regulator
MSGIGGKAILLAEDMGLIALDLIECLCDARALVVGPFANVAGALAEIGRTSIDGAVIDLNLRDSMAYPLMDALMEAEIPFVIVSGYSRARIPLRFRHSAFLEKPYGRTAVIETLEWALSSHQPHVAYAPLTP